MKVGRMRTLFEEEAEAPTFKIREEPGAFARMLWWRLLGWTFYPPRLSQSELRMIERCSPEALKPPVDIERDLRQTLVYWADFAGLELPVDADPIWAFERAFRLEMELRRDEHDYDAPNRAALAAVRALLS